MTRGMLVGVGALLAVGFSAEAQAQPDSVQLGVGLGIVDRASTGVGEPLLDYGYDHEGGLLAEGSLRLYFDESNGYFSHALQLRFAHTGGAALGFTDHGIGYSMAEVAYVFRTRLPCMSSSARTFYLSGYLGLSGAYGNASTGSGERDDRWNERVAAEGELDHYALGGVLGFAMDVHFGAYYVGVQVDLREHFGLTSSSPISRSFLPSALIRSGFEFEL